MQTKHLLKRGSGYIFRCRVPLDLLHCFPITTIWKGLKTKDAKGARLLADTYEYRTQKLFLQLRTQMLPKKLEAQLVAMYLNQGADALEARAKGQPIPEDNPRAAENNATNDALDMGFAALGKTMELSSRDARKKRAEYTEEVARDFEELIADKDTFLFQDAAKPLVEDLQKAHDIKITLKNVKDMALPLMNAKKQLLAADGALLRGDWNLIENLKERATKELAIPYFDLETAIKAYKVYYLASKTSVKPGTKTDMEVECRVLLEILGNIDISEANTMATLTKLKSILLKYPLNKVQRYGNRSIHSILKNEKGYDIIGLKTANEYIVRMKAVITYANKSKMLNAANVYENERFPTATAAEEQRPAYSDNDIIRLVDAICTKPLWVMNPPHPERFWIILIALFHGFRLGNIIALTKRDICQTDSGMWIFHLRSGKTQSTVRPVAICDSLLLLGFLEWVANLPNAKLFQDSSRSFSAWYNRNELRKDGTRVVGFESKYVTTDESKCLYSIRHTFAGNVFDVTVDYKITADMMGHSTGKSVTARYTKITKATTLKEITEKMHLEHINLDQLEARAKELFNHI
jgi:integrase